MTFTLQDLQLVMRFTRFFMMKSERAPHEVLEQFILDEIKRNGCCSANRIAWAYLVHNVTEKPIEQCMEYVDLLMKGKET